jgi:hypothetical protein
MRRILVGSVLPGCIGSLVFLAWPNDPIPAWIVALSLYVILNELEDIYEKLK